MTTKKYNFPPELLKAIEKENLIIFVGAGLSYNLKNEKGETIGGWGKLVKHILIDLINKEYDVAHLLPLIGKCEPIKILDLIESDSSLPKSIIIDFSKDFLELHEENDYSLHKSLYNLSRKIITTNYDEAFENAERELKKNTAFKGKTYELTKHKEIGKASLFKLHGCLSHADSMVLFPSSYQDLYNNSKDDSEHALLVLKSIIVNKTVLFIGCGMGDYQINSIFSYVKELQGDYNQKHFIITKDKLDSSLDFLEAISIREHDEITIIINELLSKKEEFTNQKKLGQRLLEQEREDLEQELMDLEEKFKLVSDDSERKDSLLKQEAIKYLKRGDSYRKSQEYKKANREYENSIKLSPTIRAYNNWAISLKALAIKQNDQNLLIKVFEKYKKATLIKPKAVYLYHNWGVSLMSLLTINKDQSLLLQALEKFKKAFKYDSEREDYDTNRKYTLSSLARLIKLTPDRKKMFEIAKTYIENMKHDGRNLSASMSLGYCLTEMAMREKDEDLYLKALKEFKKQRKLNIKNYTNYSDWGFTLIVFHDMKNDTKLLKKACEKFEKAVNLNDNSYYTYIHWGQALYRLGSENNNLNYYYMAAEKFEKAIELNPFEYSSYHSFAYTLNLFGSVKKEKGKFEKAYELYKKAHELNPKNYILLRHWGNNLLMQGDLKNELQLYNKALINFDKALKIEEHDYYSLIGKLSVFLNLSKISNDIESYNKTKEKCDDFIKKYSHSESVRNKGIYFKAEISESIHNLCHLN